MVNFFQIEKTIHIMCQEIQKIEHTNKRWQLCTEDDLLYEVAICTFSSQMVFELAVAIANYLKTEGLLEFKKAINNMDSYKCKLLDILSSPIQIELNRVLYRIRPRFNKRLVRMLSSTIEKLYRDKISLYEILSFSDSVQNARKYLIEIISGFGPKQASLFLRRIGFSHELAILDRHILCYLEMKNGINLKSVNLSNLTIYEQIEKEFQVLAKKIGFSVGCFDLAVWITIRVAKRERKI